VFSAVRRWADAQDLLVPICQGWYATGSRKFRMAALNPRQVRQVLIIDDNVDLAENIAEIL
jgi:hypothetical protein